MSYLHPIQLESLNGFLNIWKNRIHPQIQKAKLNIYGGTNTYGNFGLKHSQNMNNILNYAKSLKNLVLGSELHFREKYFIIKLKILDY